MRRLNDIDLKLLRVYAAIVDAGGLVGAQTTLNLSQSTVSSHLAQLERRLGFKLCYRGRSGFALTRAGQSIYDACTEIFAAADRFSNTAASISGELRGVLRLGIADAMVSNATWNLARVLKTFHRRAPNVVIDLSVDSPAVMQRAVLDGARDVSIGPFFRRSSGLVYVALFNERHALYCAADHPIATAGPVTADRLSEYRFVARRYVQHDDLEWLGAVTIGATVENMEAQALLIHSGEFLGLLPVHYAESLPLLTPLQQVVVQGADEYQSPFYLIHQPAAEENLLIRNFLGRVRESLTADASHQSTGQNRAIPTNRQR